MPREELTKNEEQMLNLLKKAPSSVSEISDRLDVSKEEVIKLIDKLINQGYDVELNEATREVKLLQEAKVSFEALELKSRYYRDKIKFGVIGNTNIGSKFQQPRLLAEAINIAEKEKVDFMIHTGNLVAGKRPKNRQEDLFLLTKEEQRDWVINYYPKSKKFKTYIISGKQDATFRAEKGFNIIRAICEAREDLFYRGDWSCRLHVKKANILIIHRQKGQKNPYARSYEPQKMARAVMSKYAHTLRMCGESKWPDLMILGRWGVADYIPRNQKRKMLILSVPALSYQTLSSTEEDELAPDIGLWIVEIMFDKEGNPTYVTPKWYNLAPYAQENAYLEEPPITQDGEVSLSSEEKRLIELIEEEPRSDGFLSRELNKSKKSISRMIDKLREAGYKIEIPPDTKQVTLIREVERRFLPLNIEIVKEEKFIGMGDTHFCSVYQQISMTRKTYKIATEEKVSFVAHCGDLGDGKNVFRDQERLLFVHGADPQREYIIKNYPRARGIKTYVREGSHDSCYKRDFDYNFVKHICEKRKDLIYVDEEDPVIEVNEMRIKLLHPMGGVPYALSYKPQQFAEDAVLERLAAILTGHYHVAHFMPSYMALPVFSVPCQQAQTIYLKNKILRPDLGIWIITISFDKFGNVVKIIPDYRDFTKNIKKSDY